MSGDNAGLGFKNLAPVDVLRHPFGKGALTTDGVQYCAEVATTDDNYKTVEEVTIQNPIGYLLESIELGLTAAIKSSAAAESVLWKWQISDDGVTYVDLIAEQTRAADASVYADVFAGGRFNPQAGALLTGSTFKIKFMIKSGAAGGETATGKTKNSSYVLCRYRKNG
jgi:hypothetical protein